MTSVGAAAARRSRTILFATSAPFHPPLQGDSARIGAIVGWFRDRGWRVLVAHRTSQWETQPDYDGMRARCDGLQIFAAGAASGRDTEATGACDTWCPPGFAALVGGWAASEDVDVVVAQFVFLSRCLAVLPRRGRRPVRVLDADNRFAGLRERQRAAGLGYHWFSTDTADEERAWRRADVLLAINDGEAACMRAAATGRDVVLVPHAHELVDARGGRRGVALFVASRNPANAEALRDLLASWPSVRTLAPGAELLVAGDVGRGIDAAPAGVEILGVVSNLEPLYRRAAIVVNPVRAGAGVSIKTVEALAHGKCLVTTPAGVRGLPNAERAAIVVAAHEELPRRMCELIADPVRCMAVGEQAWSYAARRLTPKRVFAPLERVLAMRLAAHEPPPAHAKA